VQQKEFPGIATRDEFAAHIEDVMSSGTRSQLQRDRVGYWKDGTFVVRDPANPDGGSAFRPTQGYQYFLDQRRDYGDRAIE
jgi:hypothetical protein